MIDALDAEHAKVTGKLIDGTLAVNESPEAVKPLQDEMAQKRKGELKSWLQQRLNAGLISNKEF